MRVSERLSNMLPSFSETRFMERPGGTPKSARGVVPSPSRLTQALGAAPTASCAEKYESKAFVRAVGFRGSDVAAANLCDALERVAVSAAALVILPLAAAWMALGAWLGRELAARFQLADSSS
jgi:hypothetical protein